MYNMRDSKDDSLDCSHTSSISFWREIEMEKKKMTATDANQRRGVAESTRLLVMVTTTCGISHDEDKTFDCLDAPGLDR